MSLAEETYPTLPLAAAIAAAGRRLSASAPGRRLKTWQS